MQLPDEERTRSVRLHKLMSARGVGSRRRCEELISAGRVTVNGKPVTTLGVTSSPSDKITVDGKPVTDAAPPVYVMLNKPPGYLSSVGDPHGRRTVTDLVRSNQRLYPVGRLDLDSEGLILLTDDGDLTYRLTHPSFGVAREYRVQVEPAPGEATIEKLRGGVLIAGQRTSRAEVDLVRRGKDGAEMRFVIHEGRKRQLRLMCLAVGLKAKRIVRVRIGPLRLGRLGAGEHRPLTAREIEALYRSTGIPDTATSRGNWRR